MPKRSRRKISRSFLPKKRTALLTLFLLLLGSALGIFLPGRCIHVTDGDSITVMDQGGTVRKVRLYGIDAPELKQPYGQEAATATRDMALLQNVRLEVQDVDQYGRSVAIVTLEDGRILNEELVATGQAMVYGQYCKHPRCIIWKAYELKARTQGLGLWSAQHPVPPWEWRKRHTRNKQK